MVTFYFGEFVAQHNEISKKNGYSETENGGVALIWRFFSHTPNLPN
jgi:hypothetical protein